MSGKIFKLPVVDTEAAISTKTLKDSCFVCQWIENIKIKSHSSFCLLQMSKVRVHDSEFVSE